VRITTLAEARAYLDGFLNLEKTRDFAYERLGLDRIRSLLAGLGNPERGLPCVHIAGSKGKGSTAWLVEALLAAARRRVGTYTSPHLECWSERFRVCGETVSEAVLLHALNRLQPVADKLREDPRLRPSFFDVSTALALQIFHDAEVDVAVVEVGLGGRIDSTNVVESKVSLITTVQLEHTEKLGSSLEAIAREKAGILRASTPALHGPMPIEALGAVLGVAVATDTPIEEVSAQLIEVSSTTQRLRLEDGRELVSSLLGEHQAHNVALAVRAAEIFLGRALTPVELAALASCHPPARLERFGDSIVLDCAHTPDSIAALCRSLAWIAPRRRWVLVTSISQDKDAASMLQALAPTTRACIACRAEPVRSLDPVEVEALAFACGIEQPEACEDPIDALDRAREILEPDELLVVAGSIYLAGAVRGLLVDEFGG